MKETLDFEENLDYGDDFGFSEDEGENLEDVEDRVEKIKNLFLPLLFNLLKDPEAEYIYWPNRKEQIEKIIKIVQET